jgi:hypothetical protein
MATAHAKKNYTLLNRLQDDDAFDVLKYLSNSMFWNLYLTVTTIKRQAYGFKYTNHNGLKHKEYLYANGKYDEMYFGKIKKTKTKLITKS